MLFVSFVDLMDFPMRFSIDFVLQFFIWSKFDSKIKSTSKKTQKYSFVSCFDYNFFDIKTKIMRSFLFANGFLLGRGFLLSNLLAINLFTQFTCLSLKCFSKHGLPLFNKIYFISSSTFCQISRQIAKIVALHFPKKSDKSQV